MKGFITSLCLLASLSLVSCDETARLAKDLQGSWAGTPENFTDNSVITATIVETLDIVSDDNAVAKGSHGGTVVVAGMLSATTQVVSDPGLVEPITLTSSAKSTIKGTWTAIDDDEVALILDMSTLSVELDPDGVAVSNNILTNNDTPKIDSIKPAISASIAESMKRALTTRYASVRRLDDVKIKGPLLKFEIGKTDYVFTRQGKVQ